MLLSNLLLCFLFAPKIAFGQTVRHFLKHLVVNNLLIEIEFVAVAEAVSSPCSEFSLLPEGGQRNHFMQRWKWNANKCRCKTASISANRTDICECIEQFILVPFVIYIAILDSSCRLFCQIRRQWPTGTEFNVCHRWIGPVPIFQRFNTFNERRFRCATGATVVAQRQSTSSMSLSGEHKIIGLQFKLLVESKFHFSRRNFKSISGPSPTDCQRPYRSAIGFSSWHYLHAMAIMI